MFNIGDKVKCLKKLDIHPTFQVNKIYTVVEFKNYGNAEGWNSIVEDDKWIIINHKKVKPNFELVTEEKQMSKVNYHLLGDSVIINHAGKTTAIKRGDIRFLKVVQAIRENRLSDIPDLIYTESALEKLGLILKDGNLIMDGEALPDSLSNRVLRLIEEELPIEIMVKFWKNLKQNPSFNSRKMLYAFLEHNGHPLTEDGCFIAYRGVTDEFKDRHTGKMDNSVGQVVSVPRTEVDDNPNNTCSHGLHVACYDYAKDFASQLIEVKVNPADVVAVPTDYNGTKMRVCKFEVLAVGEKLRTEAVYNVDSEEKQDDDYYSSDENYYDSDNN